MRAAALSGDRNAAEGARLTLYPSTNPAGTAAPTARWGGAALHGLQIAKQRAARIDRTPFPAAGRLCQQTAGQTRHRAFPKRCHMLPVSPYPIHTLPTPATSAASTRRGGEASICAPVYPQQSDARWVLQPAAVQGRSGRSSHTALSHITANAGPAWARRAVSAFTSGLFSSTGCFFLWYSKAPELEAPLAGRMASV